MMRDGLSSIIPKDDTRGSRNNEFVAMNPFLALRALAADIEHVYLIKAGIA
jgi:hypothetical protein